MKIALLALILVLANVPIRVQAEENPHTQGLVSAAGLGTVDAAKARNKIQAKLLAKRAAIVDAQRNLLEMIEGVRVTSGTTVKDAQLESDLVANRVKGLLQGAFTMNESVTEESGEFLAEVTLGICLNASLSECKGRPSLSQVMYAALEKAPPEARFTADPAPGSSRATGLIVDVSGLEFEPLFDVRLVTSQGKEVYGPGSFDVSAGDDWLHWTRTLDAARAKAEVIGDAPLVIVAAGMAGAEKVVLENDDAVRIFQANLENGDFLKKGKVIFVVR